MRIIYVIGYNNLEASGCKHVAAILETTNTLTHLNLSNLIIIFYLIGDNNIQAEGALYLSKALKINKTLIWLNLSIIFN